MKSHGVFFWCVAALAVAAGGAAAQHSVLGLHGRWHIDLPVEPVGLTWDGGSFWITEAGTSLIHQVDPDSAGEHGILVSTVETSLERPSVLAWAGGARGEGRFWIMDSGVRPGLLVEVAIAHENGRAVLESARAVPAPGRAGWYPETVSGLAWDGRDLWVACGGGLCARVYRFDPYANDVRMSFFPMCNPRGLVFDGTHLSMIALNSRSRPSRLCRRVASDGLRELVDSVECPQVVAVDRPVALAFDGSEIWMAERDQRMLVRLISR